jgi:DNA-binding HxlR family transcriptional regulator
LKIEFLPIYQGAAFAIRTHNFYTATNSDQPGNKLMKSAPWCPVASTIHVIGGKWKPMILLQLKDGPRGFNELRRLIPAITQRMLTLQLKALERDGIVMRTVFETNPPTVEYAFSKHGLSLGPILEQLEHWGEANQGRGVTV